MTNANLPLYASAILVWLPKAIKPDLKNFDLSQVQSPPSPNPEIWWTLEDAIVHAVTVQRDHDKLPWIKTGDQLLSAQEILTVYRRIRPPGSPEHLLVA